MSVVVKVGNTQVQALSPVKVTTLLDTEMDSGSLRFMRTEARTSGVVAPLSEYSVEIGENAAFSFIGTDSKALVRQENSDTAIFLHDVALVEPAKLLEGVIIDGFAVTQPADETQRTSLLETVERLLRIAIFDTNGTAVAIIATGQCYDELAQTVSPQFKWNTQTTLWECLVQVGAVLDMLPRLHIEDGSWKIEFYHINASDYEVTLFWDAAVNTHGENIAEGQYNTALSAVVENLMEE